MEATSGSPESMTGEVSTKTPEVVCMISESLLTVGGLMSIREELGEEGAVEFMERNSLTHYTREQTARRYSWQ